MSFKVGDLNTKTTKIQIQVNNSDFERSLDNEAVKSSECRKKLFNYIYFNVIDH